MLDRQPKMDEENSAYVCVYDSLAVTVFVPKSSPEQTSTEEEVNA